MNTRKSPRNHEYIKGQYLKEKVSSFPVSKPKRKTQHVDVQAKRFQDEIHEIRQHIITSLKRSKCYYKSFNIRISLDFKKYLARKYNLKTTLKNGNQFLADFKIKTALKENEVSSWVVRDQSFEFKFIKQKTTNYKNEDDTLSVIKSPHYIKIDFIVTNKPTIDPASMKRMKNYLLNKKK